MVRQPATADQDVSFQPDFLQIPSVVAFDKDLQPLDKLVYAVVFWFERLKDGRCYASNATMGKIVGSSASGVSHAVSRLNDKGYIVVILDDKNQRKEIRTLVFNQFNPSSNELGGVAQMSYIDKNTKKKYSSEMLTDIKKCYNLWLKYMVVDPDIRLRGTTDERRAALQAAAKSYRLTDGRRDAVARRIEDAGLQTVAKAIHAIAQSEFHRGENERGWTAGLDWLCKSYEKVEEWANKYQPEGQQQ